MSAPPAIPSLEPITAPLLLGAMFNWGLWGILACQTYLYRMYFAKDKLAFKVLIYGTFLLETVQTALSTHDTYVWFAKGFADPAGLGKTLISPFDVPMMGAIIALIVQSFYVYRIWTLNKSLMWFCVFIVLITVAQTVGSFIGSIRGLKAGVFSEAPDSTSVVYLWLVGEAVADVLISGAMFFLLLAARKEKYRPSQDLLFRVVILIVESNALTAGLAILSLIMFAGFPNQNWFTCPTLVLGKVYANSLLVSFNNRIVLRNLPPTGTSSSKLPSSQHPLSSHTAGSTSKAEAPPRDYSLGEETLVHTFTPAEKEIHV